MNEKKILVAVVAYKRSNHLFRCLTSIQKFYNKDKHEIIVFQDYDENQSKEWKSTNLLIKNFKFITRVNKVNLGLRENIFSILYFFYKSNYSNLILIEDDIIINENFFNYFDYTFHKFENNDTIFQISGFSPLNFKSNYYLIYPRISTWGWGTWKNKFPNPEKIKLDWNNFELTEDLRLIIKEYMPDVLHLVELKLQGKINAWSLDFLIFMLSNKLNTLYPGNSLVENIGFDGSGENCNNVKPIFKIERKKTSYKEPKKLLDLNKSKAIFKGHYSPSIIKKILDKVILIK